VPRTPYAKSMFSARAPECPTLSLPLSANRSIPYASLSSHPASPTSPSPARACATCITQSIHDHSRLCNSHGVQQSCQCMRANPNPNTPPCFTRLELAGGSAPRSGMPGSGVGGGFSLRLVLLALPLPAIQPATQRAGWVRAMADTLMKPSMRMPDTIALSAGSFSSRYLMNTYIRKRQNSVGGLQHAWLAMAPTRV
jgi:hypothetical protein